MAVEDAPEVNTVEVIVGVVLPVIVCFYWYGRLGRKEKYKC